MKSETVLSAEHLIEVAESSLTSDFERESKTAFLCQKRVMKAFSDRRVSAECFNATSGYGYNDKGREVCDAVFADALEAESAFVRHSIVSGTHALTIALFGLLRPGETLLAVTGKPYDTLDEVIGLRGNGMGSLKDFGVKYREITTGADGSIDIDSLVGILKSDKTVKAVYMQLSRGYGTRPTLSSSSVKAVADAVKSRSDAFIIVDNCYGEFCEDHEPCYYGADVSVGSLIKNPGGGIAESGGYIAGTKKAVELCSYRLTSPGIGLECGATLGQTKSIIKGLFYAPHTVLQAKKCAMLAAAVFSDMGYEVDPLPHAPRYDIIEAIRFKEREPLIAFCEGIQAGSPVDSFVTPVPWAMPGYADEVIMAAGAFTQGSSIELSADAPLREPYIAYLQGGLTYESAKIGILHAVNKLLEAGHAVIKYKI